MSIKVTLLSYTPEPEKVVAMAAKLCYSHSDIDNISAGLNEEKISSFIKMLSDLGHESPIEHVSFTFGIEGISRACSHQLVRHRIASYSQQSQRYVDGKNFDFVVPPEIKRNEKALQIYNESIEKQMQTYESIKNELLIGYINDFCKGKINGTNAEIIEKFRVKNKQQFSIFDKKANEDARFILPNASTTKIICTFNVRSLQNFFRHRCCNRAQWEIREVAEKMLLECLRIAPNLFKNSGPSCLSGKCPEGKLSCGKQKEIKEKYKIVNKE